MNQTTYNEKFMRLPKNKGLLYGHDLHEEVHLYAERAKTIAKEEKFDIIHAHDWMTYKAGINAKKYSRKPLVVHVHATELTGQAEILTSMSMILNEKECISRSCHCCKQFHKNMIMQHYGVPDEKISVVHNAVEFPQQQVPQHSVVGKNVVLFLGRLTLQKGPEYFIDAAKKVLEFEQTLYS